MSKNYNPKSRHIIISWYEKAANSINGSHDNFDSFISLWISFNAFFVSEYYLEAKKHHKIKFGRGEPSERDYIELISANEDYKNIYLGLIEESYTFKENLEKFRKQLNYTKFKGAIADLRPNRIDKQHAAYFESIINFKQFMEIVYQVRCNLFHGNKSPHKDDDNIIVKTIFDSFMEYLTKIYTKEGYLND